MATPKITTLPASIRDEAAREAEKVVQFDEGDFYLTTDAVSEIVAGYYIKQGAQAAALHLGFHFRDDSGRSWVPGVSDEDLEAFEQAAVQHVMSSVPEKV